MTTSTIDTRRVPISPRHPGFLAAVQHNLPNTELRAMLDERRPVFVRIIMNSYSAPFWLGASGGIQTDRRKIIPFNRLKDALAAAERLKHTWTKVVGDKMYQSIECVEM